MSDETHPLYLLRYADLERMQLCRSRSQLNHMMAKEGFPTGFLLSSNIRAWKQSEIEDWIASRPTGKVPLRGRAKQLVEGAA